MVKIQIKSPTARPKGVDECLIAEHLDTPPPSDKVKL